MFAYYVATRARGNFLVIVNVDFRMPVGYLHLSNVLTSVFYAHILSHAGLQRPNCVCNLYARHPSGL